MAAGVPVVASRGPLIDRVHGAGPLTHAPTGVTIAVVGVIGGLAVFVGQNVFVVDDRPGWVVLALALAAFIAVWRYRASVLPIVGACALVGVLAESPW